MRYFYLVGKILIVLFATIGMVFTFIFFGIRYGWTNVKGTIKERNDSFLENLPKQKSINEIINGVQYPHYAWEDSAEWQVMKTVFIRDKDIINKASIDAGISPRILLGGIIGEQFRFFTNSRDSFKKYFEPLKILASLSKFSYGIAGLKPDTVARIDVNLKNPNSVFYLGTDMENIVTYPDGADITKTQFDRITDVKNPYYSYLYTGLFMRQVTMQWNASGVDISNNPGVLSTLYNLGFNRSIPKLNPVAGGAIITIDGTEYSFGQLGDEFYYSAELREEFPQ
ncbi:DUF1402 family protein [Candidatus Nomurabacteria bacterium]|nr:DUF1402 family protein [Candidatus Nomurabacteria bacterium]